MLLLGVVPILLWQENVIEVKVVMISADQRGPIVLSGDVMDKQPPIYTSFFNYLIGGSNPTTKSR